MVGPILVGPILVGLILMGLITVPMSIATVVNGLLLPIWRQRFWPKQALI